MEAAGLQRYWTLTLLTLSYLVSFFSIPRQYRILDFFLAFSKHLMIPQIGELGHFLLGATSRDMAREIGYGDLACFASHPNFTDICNQRSAEDCNTECIWQQTGLGLDYQVLAGPAFIAVFTVSGALLGLAADYVHRLRLLSGAVLTFSLAICLTGCASQYWQLVILRMLLAAGESACTPVMVSLLTDLFSSKSRGAATGVLHFGVYLGFGLSQALGIHLTRANLLGLGWRPVYLLSGIPGLFLALLLLTVPDPRERQRRKAAQPEETICLQLEQEKVEDDNNNSPRCDGDSIHRLTSFSEDMICLARVLFSPLMLLLFLAAATRHCSGFTWAYNARLYFLSYYPEAEVGLWLPLSAIVGGTVAVFLGGSLADRLASQGGAKARLAVLGSALVLSSPLAAGTLYLDPPLAFVSLLGYYLLAETWFGILFVTLVEVAPPRVKTSVLGIFLFMMNNVGGNLPVLLDPLSKLVGYREALLFLFPGMVGFSGLLFLLAILPLQSHLVLLEKLTHN